MQNLRSTSSQLSAPPLAPSIVISPSQIARRYRSQTCGIEHRAGIWQKRGDAFARVFRSEDPSICYGGAELNDGFWKRFMQLPGEGEYDFHLFVFRARTSNRGTIIRVQRKLI